MEIKGCSSDDLQEKYNSLLARFEDVREKMEIDTQTFIEATKQFTLEWTQIEIEQTILSLESRSSTDNLESDVEKISKLKSSLKELACKVPDIVEAHLNLNYLWIHRNTQLQAGISQDYVEFKKNKMQKELTTSVRMILGRSTEIFDSLKDDGKPAEQGWVKEKGRRKYVCFLRFSDEMTACLNSYLEKLEEFFILSYEIKEETPKAI